MPSGSDHERSRVSPAALGVAAAATLASGAAVVHYADDDSNDHEPHIAWQKKDAGSKVPADGIVSAPHVKIRSQTTERAQRVVDAGVQFHVNPDAGPPDDYEVIQSMLNDIGILLKQLPGYNNELFRLSRDPETDPAELDRLEDIFEKTDLWYAETQTNEDGSGTISVSHGENPIAEITIEPSDYTVEFKYYPPIPGARYIIAEGVDLAKVPELLQAFDGLYMRQDAANKDDIIYHAGTDSIFSPTSEMIERYNSQLLDAQALFNANNLPADIH